MGRLEHFETLVAQQPENELFRFSLAQALESAGRSSEAVTHYQYCVQKKPDWMMARILLGKRYVAMGQRDRARAELEIALRLAVEQSHEEPERELRDLLADLAG